LAGEPPAKKEEKRRGEKKRGEKEEKEGNKKYCTKKGGEEVSGGKNMSKFTTTKIP
jgi:hypothetical protein